MIQRRAGSQQRSQANPSDSFRRNPHRVSLPLRRPHAIVDPQPVHHGSSTQWDDEDEPDDNSWDPAEAPTVPFHPSDRPTVILPKNKTTQPTARPRARSTRDRVATFYPTPLPLDTPTGARRRSRLDDLDELSDGRSRRWMWMLGLTLLSLLLPSVVITVLVWVSLS